MRFNLLMLDGKKISGEVRVPGPPVSALAQATALKQVNDPRHAPWVRPMLNAVIPGIAASLEPHMPPAASAIKKVQVIEDPGRGTTTTRTTSRPETPPPAIHAQQFAERLAPYVVAEQLVGHAAKLQAAHALAVPAASAVARQLMARVAQLEDRFTEAEQGRLKDAAQ